MTENTADTAAAQLRRLLHVIPRLADGQDHPINLIARLAGVEDSRQLVADLRSMVERFNLPGAFVEGVQIWIDNRNVTVVSSHFQRPMRLTMSEISALELGLAVLRAEQPPSEHAVLERALQRLRSAMTDLGENAAHEGLRSATIDGPGSKERLATIRRAITEQHRVRINYQGGTATEARWRTVCPYGVVFASGWWYVVAHCGLSEGMRFFRLDRISAVEVTDETYEIPAEFTLGAVAADGRVLEGTPITRMCVRYSARIAPWIAEREGVTPESDGTLVVEHPVHDVGWTVRHVLQYGPDAEVIGPPELRGEVIERLDAMARSLATA